MRLLSLGVRTLAVFFLLKSVLFVPSFSAAQSTDNRSLHWDRFDVTIENIVSSENRFDVTETYELTILTGPFRFGSAEIPMDRLESIENLIVYDGDFALQASCAGDPGTYCVSENSDSFSFTYYFLQPAESGQRRTIRLKYTVLGALRSYEDGDELYWVAVPGDRPFPVLDSRVTVTLPPDRPPKVTASYPNTWTETIDGNTITWEAPGSLGNTGEVEVRVKYLHDPAMPIPSWQATENEGEFGCNPDQLTEVLDWSIMKLEEAYRKDIEDALALTAVSNRRLMTFVSSCYELNFDGDKGFVSDPISVQPGTYRVTLEMPADNPDDPFIYIGVTGHVLEGNCQGVRSGWNFDLFSTGSHGDQTVLSSRDGCLLLWEVQFTNDATPYSVRFEKLY